MSGDVLEELDSQGAEITRLRADNDKLRGIIRLQDAAIRSDTATLASAELEALEWVTNHYQRVCDEYGPSSYDIQLLSTIRGLLARCATSTRERDA